MTNFYACCWALLRTEGAKEDLIEFKSLKKMKKWLRKMRRKKNSPWFWRLYKKDFGKWNEFKNLFLCGKEDEKWLKKGKNRRK